MALALDILTKVDTPLNKETKQPHSTVTNRSRLYYQLWAIIVIYKAEPSLPQGLKYGASTENRIKNSLASITPCKVPLFSIFAYKFYTLNVTTIMR